MVGVETCRGRNQVGQGGPAGGKEGARKKGRGERGRVADRGAGWGAEVLRFSCFVRRGGRRGQQEETAERAVFRRGVRVAARALGGLPACPGTVCLGDFIPGQPVLLILEQACCLSGCAV